MKHGGKKILALLLTLVLMLGVLPGMSAFAAELSESLTVNFGAKPVNLSGSHFNISADNSDGDGAAVGDLAGTWSSVTVSSLNGENIVKIEATIGYNDIETLAVNPGNISGTIDTGSTITVNNINATSVTFTQPTQGQVVVQLKNFTIYYSSGYTVTYVASNGSGETKEYTPAAGETHTVQGQLFPAPEGMEFAGWLGDDGRAYLPGAPITETRTLTAVWEIPQRNSTPEKVPEDDGWEYHGGGNTEDRAYRSSFAPMQGGKAQLVLNNGETAELMNIYPGTTVWVNPIPDPGYRVASIVWSMIDGSASFDITETKCFVMPAMEVVIFVTFQPIA